MRQHTNRRWAACAATGAITLGLLAGCSGADSSSGSAGAAPSMADSQAMPTPGDSEQAAAQPAAPGATTADVVQPGQVEQPQRRKVSRAEVAVTVEDLSKSSAAVRALAAANGGYVASESVGISELTSVDHQYSSGSGYSSDSYAPTPSPYPPGGSPLYAQPGEARIVLRVAPDQTQATMDEIAKVGEETSRWRTDTDVELQLVDLESRIATQEQSIADLRLLMAKATTVGEIITVEQEITSRTSNLESLKAQRASLSDASAYSTVTAVLRTAERSEQAKTEVGFMGGLTAGWDALVRSVRVLLTFFGAVLPFAVVAGLIWYPVRRWLQPRIAQRLATRRAAREAAAREAAERQAQQWQLAHAAAPGSRGQAGPASPPSPAGRPGQPAAAHPSEPRSSEPRPTEPRSSENRATENRATENRATENRSAEPGPDSPSQS